MGAGSVTARCVICGEGARGRVLLSVRGELVCAGHTTVGRCRFCGRPRGLDEPGWHEFEPAGWRCPTCGDEAVDTIEGLRRHVRGVRQVTAELGFGLRSRVRVVFATFAELAAGHAAAGTPLACTELTATAAGVAEAVVVRVARGLPAFAFGRSVAHEVGHVWLAQSAAGPRRPPVEEGLCELVAYAWLKRSPYTYAEQLRDLIRTNPDPVYGGGFREVHAALTRHGIASLRASLATTGELPAHEPRSSVAPS